MIGSYQEIQPFVWFMPHRLLSEARISCNHRQCAKPYLGSYWIFYFDPWGKILEQRKKKSQKSAKIFRGFLWISVSFEKDLIFHPLTIWASLDFSVLPMARNFRGKAIKRKRKAPTWTLPYFGICLHDCALLATYSSKRTKGEERQSRKTQKK